MFDRHGVAVHARNAHEARRQEQRRRVDARVKGDRSDDRFRRAKDAAEQHAADDRVRHRREDGPVAEAEDGARAEKRDEARKTRRERTLHDGAKEQLLGDRRDEHDGKEEAEAVKRLVRLKEVPLRDEDGFGRGYGQTCEVFDLGQHDLQRRTREKQHAKGAFRHRRDREGFFPRGEAAFAEHDGEDEHGADGELHEADRKRVSGERVERAHERFVSQRRTQEREHTQEHLHAEDERERQNEREENGAATRQAARMYSTFLYASERMSRRTLRSTLLVAVLASGCGASAANAPAERSSSVPLPAVVNAASVAEAETAFFRLGLDDAERGRLREEIVNVLAEELRLRVERREYAEVVAGFERIMDLFQPADFDRNAFPASVEPIARFLVERGSQRSDEGVVLSALRVLSAIERTPESSARYAALRGWSAEVRANIGSAVDRFDGWVREWEEHARLSPAQDVLDGLAQLYADRRDAYARMLMEQPVRGLLGGVSMQDFRAANYASVRTPYDVAAVYMRAGDLASAEARLRALTPMDGTSEARLAMVIGVARQEGADDAANALLTLASGYMQDDIGRPDVSRSLCRLGRRRYATDARFARCLAQVAAIMGEASRASAHYREAIALDPNDAEAYDQALATIDAMLRQKDPTDAVVVPLAEDALEILDERARRLGAESPARREQLELVLARAKLATGDLARAEEILTARSGENAERLLLLGRLYASTGRAEQAAELYRRAIDLVPSGVPGGEAVQARLQQLLAEAFALAGNEAQARRLNEQALAAWRRIVTSSAGEPIAEPLVQIGILEDLLGNSRGMRESFEQALAEGGASTAVFARMLGHLVVAREPNPALAIAVQRTAARSVALDRSWKAYFALWAGGVVARSGAAPDRELLDDLRRIAGEGDWAGKLARFGVGELDYDALVEAASNPGEQTEAHFYGALALIGRGDLAGARARLERVLGLRMVEFHEYQMATGLLPRLREASPAPRP